MYKQYNTQHIKQWGITMQKKLLVSLLCFIPSVLGLIFWAYIPNELAVHFGTFGIDGYGDKLTLVYWIPLLFFIINLIYIFIIKKFPDWINPIFKSNQLFTYLFPILSVLTFLLSISNSI